MVLEKLRRVAATAGFLWVCSFVAAATQTHAAGTSVQFTDVGDALLHTSFLGVQGENRQGEVVLFDSLGGRSRIDLSGRSLVGWSATGFALARVTDDSMDVELLDREGESRGRLIVDLAGSMAALVGDLFLTYPAADHEFEVPFDITLFAADGRYLILQREDYLLQGLEVGGRDRILVRSVGKDSRSTRLDLFDISREHIWSREVPSEQTLYAFHAPDGSSICTVLITADGDVPEEVLWVKLDQDDAIQLPRELTLGALFSPDQETIYLHGVNSLRQIGDDGRRKWQISLPGSLHAATTARTDGDEEVVACVIENHEGRSLVLINRLDGYMRRSIPIPAGPAESTPEPVLGIESLREGQVRIFSAHTIVDVRF